ncbi:SDR family NAD(P)-dependent oxidoreductase [Williamsia sterculiae]|nr:SDR family NAD(P)-dependent oxidoreductase [Williamsia sterculiae]
MTSTHSSTSPQTGTVLITGPTGSLGREATLAMAHRPPHDRPDLILVGRPGGGLDDILAEVRATGTTAHAIGADLGHISEVRAAAARAQELVTRGTVRPLRALVANAGVTGSVSGALTTDGYERTFAVNHVAHAALIGDLLRTFTSPARIVLIGSNTYYQNIWRRILGVAPSEWKDPLELTAPESAPHDLHSAGVAYSTSKLAILYYAHELQRRAPEGVAVSVFEPGWMPSTGLAREMPAALRRVMGAIARIPGVSSPRESGPLLASVALDEKWASLRDGAFVVKTEVRDVEPFAVDRERESRLWTATAELIERVS